MTSSDDRSPGTNSSPKELRSGTPFALSKENDFVTAKEKRERLMPFQLNLYARKGLLAGGNGFSVALHESERLLCIGADRRGQSAVTSLVGVIAVFAEGSSVAALCADGTLHLHGRSPEETEFASRLVTVHRVALGKRHIAVLMGNGSVRIGGRAHRGGAAFADWKDITDITAGADFTAGLCADGRVFVAGGSYLMRERVSRWSNMVSIVADPEENILYGIDIDGELHATRRLLPGMSAWKKLVQISVWGGQLCAVTASGQLLSTLRLPPELTEGKSYVAVAVGEKHILALNRDGRLTAYGDNRYGQCETSPLGRMFERYEEFTVRRRDSISAPRDIGQAIRTRAAEAARFNKMFACSERLSACITAYGRALTSPAFTDCKTWQDIYRLSCGNTHVLGLRTDGCVLADGNGNDGCCHVSEWRNVREIVAGSYHSLGVTYDGSVYFCGSNEHGQGDVSEWHSIRKVSTTDTYTVGLTHDGRLLLAGLPPFDQQLLLRIDAPVADVVATATHILCRYEDGRAFATLPPDPFTGRTQCDNAVFTWQGISAIAANGDISVGLCHGGTVSASGVDPQTLSELSSWQGMVSVDCGSGYVVGLDYDGRLHIAGTPAVTRECRTDLTDIYESSGTPMYRSFADAERWQDIIAFVCAPTHLLALNRDGQVLACGSDSDGQCSVTTHFTLFRDARSLWGYGSYRSSDETR